MHCIALNKNGSFLCNKSNAFWGPLICFVCRFVCQQYSIKVMLMAFSAFWRTIYTKGRVCFVANKIYKHKGTETSQQNDMKSSWRAPRQACSPPTRSQIRLQMFVSDILLTLAQFTNEKTRHWNQKAFISNGSHKIWPYKGIFLSSFFIDALKVQEAK